jgi:hypothetical protein
VVIGLFYTRGEPLERYQRHNPRIKQAFAEIELRNAMDRFFSRWLPSVAMNSHELLLILLIRGLQYPLQPRSMRVIESAIDATDDVLRPARNEPDVL